MYCTPFAIGLLLSEPKYSSKAFFAQGYTYCTGVDALKSFTSSWSSQSVMSGVFAAKLRNGPFADMLRYATS